MGQQQILLIVLGVIVVGIAVAIGITMFSSSHDESVKDELVTQSLAIGANAQQFFIKAGAMGGGNNTFNTGGSGNNGYVIPLSMKSTTNATYTGVATLNNFTITATPVPITGKSYNFASVTTIVSPSSITTSIN